MKVLVLFALLGACTAQYYNAPSNNYGAPLSGFVNGGGTRGNSGYSSGAGSNSGFSGSRGGSFGFHNGNSGFGGFGLSNGNNGASSFDSSRSYGPVIHVGGNQNSGFGSNFGSRFGSSSQGSQFIVADNGFNS